MKVIILLITVSFLFSCGKKPPIRKTRLTVPVLDAPTIPPTYRLTHTCNRAKSSTKTVWNCYNNSSLYKMCVITYRASFDSYSCNHWLYELENELDSFQCAKSSGGGFNTMDCYKEKERCVFKYGKLFNMNCYSRGEDE
jgi:hypothetical protein